MQKDSLLAIKLRIKWKSEKIYGLFSFEEGTNDALNS